MQHRKGFSIWEMVVLGVIAVVVVALVVVLPMMGTPKKTSCGGRSTRVRGIHSALVLYSQSNNTYFPGINSDGTVATGDAATVGRRFRTLLEANYFTGEYVISPNEIGTKTQWTSGTVTTANFSYAMLSLMDTGGTRNQEWRDTNNKDAPVVSDRNSGTDASSNVQSIHVPNAGAWRGYVAWNDNHVTWELSHKTTTNTKYGSGAAVTDDNLFADDNDDAGNAGNDALLEYTSD